MPGTEPIPSAAGAPEAHAELAVNPLPDETPDPAPHEGSELITATSKVETLQVMPPETPAEVIGEETEGDVGQINAGNVEPIGQSPLENAETSEIAESEAIVAPSSAEPAAAKSLGDTNNDNSGSLAPGSAEPAKTIMEGQEEEQREEPVQKGFFGKLLDRLAAKPHEIEKEEARRSEAGVDIPGEHPIVPIAPETADQSRKDRVAEVAAARLHAGPEERHYIAHGGEKPKSL